MDLNPLLICWSVRGLNNPAKRKAMREFLDTVKINLVCLQETKLDVIDQFIVLQCFGLYFDDFAYLSAVETHGGILLPWNSMAIDVHNLSLNDNFISGLVCDE